MPTTPDNVVDSMLRLDKALKSISIVSLVTCTAINELIIKEMDCTRTIALSIGVLKKTASQGAIKKRIPEQAIAIRMLKQNTGL